MACRENIPASIRSGERSSSNRPAIITGGLILGFRNCIDSLYIFQGGHTLVELSQFWAGVDHFLWLIGEAVFHVGIPVGICWSITGLHHMTNAIDLQLIADFGGTMLWPMIALSNIAQGSAVLGMIFLQKKNAEAQEVNVPSCISCYLGVTEPAIFDINLKYMFPFVCGMTGSAIAGMFSVLTGCMASSIGVGGLPGILSMKPQFWGFYAVAMLIAVAVPFILTTVIGKTRGIDKEVAAADADEDAAPAPALEAVSGPVEMTAFLSGKTVDIHEVPDQVFASGALGEGIAIDPTDNVLVAPADAVVTTTMPDSNHAVGLCIANGAEILLHIGLDTVSMNGDGFTCHVKEGRIVRKGDRLITFDTAQSSIYSATCGVQTRPWLPLTRFPAAGS